MADSLIIGEEIELAGGGVLSTNPNCPGTTFYLADPFDLGAPQPVTDFVATLIGDGERPSGDRASNRTSTLPVVIRVRSTGVPATDRTTLAAARELLLQTINRGQFTLKWTRDGGGLPMVIDCYRAHAAVPVYSIKQDKALVSQVTISFDGSPYGRSDVPVIADFTSPLAGKSAAPSPVLIDGYGAVSSTQFTQSMTYAQGPFSAHYAPPVSNPQGLGVAAKYSATGLSLNLTNMNGVTLWAGFASSAFFSHWAKKGGPVRFAFTLTDSAGKKMSWSKTVNCRGSNTQANPIWQRIRSAFPKLPAGFNLASVTAYTITVTNRSATGDLAWTDLYLDTYTATPVVVSQAISPVRGAVYDLTGIMGSARTPVSLQLQQAGTPTLVTEKFTVGGTQNWVAPALVASVAVTNTGCGGSGWTASSGFGGGGGSGGTAFNAAVAVTSGQAYLMNIGKGPLPNTGNGTATTFTGDSVTVTANFGHSATSSTGGTAGAAGTGGFAGAAGGNGSSPGGGGGASSAGTSAAGNPGATGASGGAGGAAVTGGGKGGRGATASNVAVPGTAPGAGGGGGVSGVASGAKAADGQVILTYLAPPTFDTLIVHRPAPGSPASLCPFVTPNAFDVPDGTTEYPVPTLVPGVNARFGGTYTIVAVASSLASTGSSRKLTVTVNEYEQAGGAVYSSSVARTFTPDTDTFTPGGVPITSNPLIVVGDLTLPNREMPADNINGLFTITLTDTNTADRYLDVLFLDTQGQTVMISSRNPYVNYFLDAPDGDRDIGMVLGSLFDRGDSISVVDSALITGGPMLAAPDGNQALMVYALEGAPSAELIYFARWMLDRTA